MQFPQQLVAPQLADETLFLSYPKEELEKQVPSRSLPLASVQRFVCESVQTNLFGLKQQIVCALLFSVQCFTCIILFKMSRFCAMHFSESDSILFKC